MSSHDLHHDWLSLVEISGPFLAVPVLKEAFPQGLEELDGLKRKRLRQAYDEWREALEMDDWQFDKLHAAWVDEVLSRGLGLDEDGKGDVMKRADWCANNLNVSFPEHGVMLAPNLAVVDEQRGNRPLMLIHTYDRNVDLDVTLKLDGWAATPADRMVQLCRAAGCRLGLVTNGERWMLVDAPVGTVTTFVSWYSRFWAQEPITLQAFVHLLGIRRFFVDETEQLPALFDRSLKYQDEVTEALGQQVRRAIEVLIQSLDKADQDRDRELLRDVKESVLYEAALTVMMRLVFLLSAEERGLLLLGDVRYEANYALSTLRMQLRKESEEILERRWDAWSRLLAVFRAVFGGIEHENLRLPALGGSLFDPDRFPFLEGRAKGSNWRTDVAKPLPIDNRTVLLLLEAIQQFQGRTLSYRALDVEQIGYVYEGLLERTVKRVTEVTLELEGTKNSKVLWVKLAEIESARLDGAERLAELLQERSGSSVGRIRNDLTKLVDDTLADRLLAACHGDTAQRDRIKPFVHLIRTDSWGYPLVYPAGAFIVTTGSDRRETGTHYTPKSLTEAIVAETLTPITYVGPAEGFPREQWALKSPAELLDLKICDPAMGSGAFLVQVCRWLAERLVEAWSQVEAVGKIVSVDGEVFDVANIKEQLPRDTESRTLIARRLVAERCLYGVDLNPLAVELAKLSIWLVTLAKGRPFGFLDHNLRCGDSLLGIHRLDQLTELTMLPGAKGQQRLFGQKIEQAVNEATALRLRLRELPIRDIRDVEAMASLDANARDCLEVPERISDAFIGEVFTGNNGSVLEIALNALTIQSAQAIDGDQDAIGLIAQRCCSTLSAEGHANGAISRPFHWPLEFPEVFCKANGGFDAICGNPPFMGGKKLSAAIGKKYRSYLIKAIASGTRGNADLVAYFFLRAGQLLRKEGLLGLISTNTIAQGDTREVGLDQIVQSGFTIPTAISSMPWPGKAALEIAQVIIYRGTWHGQYRLDGAIVVSITPHLKPLGSTQGKPLRLAANAGKSFLGSMVLGIGFVLTEAEANELMARDPANRACLLPYLNGEDINTRPDSSPSRWIINFFDWPLRREDIGCWSTADAKQKKAWTMDGVVPIDYPHPVAADYPALLEIVEQRVKPGRLKLGKKADASAKGYARSWWRYGRMALELYVTIPKLPRFLVHPFTSKYHSLVFFNPGIVLSHMTVVLAIHSWAEYCLLQSEMHWKWALEYGNKLETRPQYSPTDCFETFAFPENVAGLEVIGESYYKLRKEMLIKHGEGLTKLYNRFHDPAEASPDIVELRNIQRELDELVVAAYGWSELTLDHGFHVTKLGLRYTICETASRDVIDRLLELNHRRYDEECSRGLQGKKAFTVTLDSMQDARIASHPQPGLGFDFGWQEN